MSPIAGRPMAGHLVLVQRMRVRVLPRELPKATKTRPATRWECLHRKSSSWLYAFERYMPMFGEFVIRLQGAFA
jgi:hypothetical protein